MNTGFEYWTLWSYGGGPMGLRVCSQHKSLDAARRSSRKCEKSGGAKHTIIKVKKVLR